MEMEISSFKVSEALRRPECFLLSDGGQAYVYLTVMDIGNKKQCQVVIKLFKLEFSSEYETEVCLLFVGVLYVEFDTKIC